MNVIELAGRLKENVILDGRCYECKGINLDKDFLIILSKELIKKVMQDEEEIELNYKKFFADEIISNVNFKIIINHKEYKIVLNRDTYDEKIIIGCIIELNKSEYELFETVYNLKVSIIEFFNKICENSNIFILQDFNNELICQNAYLKIYQVETRLRNILTKYLMKKYGELVLSKPLKKDVDEYSKWFRKETDGKYHTFKKINTDYANLDFSKIVKLLDLNDAKCIDSDGDSITSRLESLNNSLSDDIEYKKINNQIIKITEKVNKRKKVFDDTMKVENENKIDNLGTILDNDFRDLWENELSKMRNMIAHNKPICRELFNDIVDKCDEANKKFDQCFDFINKHFYSDEEGVESALEDMAYEEAKKKRFDIERAREEVGIKFSLCESNIEEELSINSRTIQKFINTVAVLEVMREYFQLIDSLNEEYRGIKDKDVDINFKLDVFKIINDELNLDKKFNDVSQLEAIDIVYQLLYSDIDIDKAISIYTDDKLYPYHGDDRFDCFNMNYKVIWFSSENKIYEVNFYGKLSPENGETDLLNFNLTINGKHEKSYGIEIYYGDYSTGFEGFIKDEEVEELVQNIEKSIRDTHTKFEQIYRISEKLMEHLDKHNEKFKSY